MIVEAATRLAAGVSTASCCNAPHVVRVRVFGARARILCRVDHEEHNRRSAAGLRTLGGLDLLDTLLELPIGSPVALRSLNARTHRALRRMPPGAVDDDGSTVVRRAVAVVHPVMAIVSARHWRDGLSRSSRFAAYCPRLTLLPAPPGDPAAAATAARLGVGLGVDRDSGVEMLVRPRRLSDWQPTPAWWWFSETVYDHMLRDS